MIDKDKINIYIEKKETMQITEDVNNNNVFQ